MSAYVEYMRGNDVIRHDLPTDVSFYMDFRSDQYRTWVTIYKVVNGITTNQIIGIFFNVQSVWNG